MAMSDQLPGQVKIGPVSYEVTECVYDGACGDTHYTKSQIRISDALSPDIRAVTLWHEIIHGILFNAGVYAAEHDEQTVDAIAHGLVGVLRDNPLMRQFY